MSTEWHINTDPDFMFKLKLLDLSLRCHIYRQVSWKSHPLQLQVWPIKNRSWWQTKRLPLICRAIWQISEKHTKIRTDVNNGSWVTLSLCVMIFTVGSLYIYIYSFIRRFYPEWLTNVTLDHKVLSRWRVLVAKANSTLYGSKWLIFLFWKKLLGY